MAFVEANKPRLIAFNAYINEEGTELTMVQVHPDAASMDFHMQVAGEKIAASYQFLEGTKSIKIYGTPSAGVLQMIEQLAGSVVPLNVKSHHWGGFTRQGSG